MSLLQFKILLSFEHIIITVSAGIKEVSNTQDALIRYLGPVSQRVAINRAMDINSSSMANRVLRKHAINRNPLWKRAPDIL